VVKIRGEKKMSAYTKLELGWQQMEQKKQIYFKQPLKAFLYNVLQSKNL